MVYISNNGFIRLARGDSFAVPLFINRGTVVSPVRYKIKNHPEATVYLGVMEPNEPFENALIKKKYTATSEINKNGDIIIVFSPNDTLNVLPGKYYYSIKIDYGNNSVDTIVPMTEFFVMNWLLWG